MAPFEYSVTADFGFTAREVWDRIRSRVLDLCRTEQGIKQGMKPRLGCLHAVAQNRTRSLSHLFSEAGALPTTVHVKHITPDFEDVPPAPWVMERRVNVDRREIWRGGRRDCDWTNRPPDAWKRLDTADRPTRWRAMLSTLHLLT